MGEDRSARNAESSRVIKERNLLDLRLLDKVSDRALFGDFSQIGLQLPGLAHELQRYCAVRQVFC